MKSVFSAKKAITTQTTLFSKDFLVGIDLPAWLKDLEIVPDFVAENWSALAGLEPQVMDMRRCSGCSKFSVTWSKIGAPRWGHYFFVFVTQMEIALPSNGCGINEARFCRWRCALLKTGLDCSTVPEGVGWSWVRNFGMPGSGRHPVLLCLWVWWEWLCFDTSLRTDGPFIYISVILYVQCRSLHPCTLERWKSVRVVLKIKSCKKRVYIIYQLVGY